MEESVLGCSSWLQFSSPQSVFQQGTALTQMYLSGWVTCFVPIMNVSKTEGLCDEELKVSSFPLDSSQISESLKKEKQIHCHVIKLEMYRTILTPSYFIFMYISINF